MSWRIKPFRRTGATGQPNIALMEEGEIAVNSYDQKIWMRVGSNLVEIANAGGSGDYVTTSGNQSNLSGNKSWTGAHTFAGNVTTTNSYSINSNNNAYFYVRNVGGLTPRAFISSQQSDNSLVLRSYVLSGASYSDLTLTPAGGLDLDGNTVWHAGNFDPASKFNTPTGSTSQYIRGDGSLATFPSGGSGTVTSVSAGNGLNFTTITGSGAVTLGTPGTISGATTNSVTTSSHTHALSANLSAWDGVTPSSKFDTPSGTTAQYIRGNGSLATFPSIPTSSDYVATSGNQTGLAGNKVWTGTHTFGTASGISDIYLASGGAQVGGIFADPDRAVVHASAGGYVSLRPGGRGSTTGEFKADYSGATWNGNEVWHAGNLTPSNYALASRSISAGNGLTGGGTLAANRTITLGTPGTLSGSTTNAVQTSSHTHALSTNLKAWDGVDVQNPLLGSTSDATSSSKTLTFASNGYAGIVAAGDYSNTSGEPGGGFFAAAIDGPSHTGSTTTILSAINTAGEDGTGGLWEGTTSNSGLLAVRGNYRLQFGANGQIAFYVASSNATFNGNVSVAGSLTVSGTNVALESRSISAGNGLSGGGTLAANRTITLGTPGTITGSSTNAVQTSSHTHALTLVAADIPNLPASKTTSGTFNAARIPNLNASKITAGTLPVTRGGTGGTSKATARNGIGIFVQSVDPGSSAAAGDLWIW